MTRGMHNGGSSFRRQTVVLVLASLVLCSCGKDTARQGLSEIELNEVRLITKEYTEAWERMDTSVVMDLFTEDAVISPSGLTPKKGKQELWSFWFGDTGSVTTVPSYEIEVLSAGGANDLAYTHERGKLSFTYTKGTYNISRDAQSYATTLYRKDSTGAWKMFHRMWTDTSIEQNE